MSGFTEIVMQAGYNGGYDENLALIIDGDTVGTYPIGTTQISFLHNGTTYAASSFYPSSGGTIIITRHDEDRIEGTFDFTLVDGGENTIDLVGSFGLEPGYMP